MHSDSSNKHLQAFRSRHVIAGEEIIAWAVATRIGELTGAAILTTRRLVYIRKGTFGDKVEPFPLSKISSVEVKPGLIFVDATVHTSGDKIALRFMKGKGEAEAFLRQVQDALHAPAAPPPAAERAVIDQIAALAELHASGILTDAEFTAKKAELLGRI